MVTLFQSLYPDVLPSTISAANSLTVRGGVERSLYFAVVCFTCAPTRIHCSPSHNKHPFSICLPPRIELP